MDDRPVGAEPVRRHADGEREVGDRGGRRADAEVVVHPNVAHSPGMMSNGRASALARPSTQPRNPTLADVYGRGSADRPRHEAVPL